MYKDGNFPFRKSWKSSCGGSNENGRIFTAVSTCGKRLNTSPPSGREGNYTPPPHRAATVVKDLLTCAVSLFISPCCPAAHRWFRLGVVMVTVNPAAGKHAPPLGFRLSLFAVTKTAQSIRKRLRSTFPPFSGRTLGFRGNRASSVRWIL